MLKNFMAVLLASIFIVPCAYAEDLQTKKLPLSIQDCIKKTLEQNLELKVQTYSQKLALINEQKTLDDFGISLGFEPSINQSVSASATSFISGGNLLKEFSQRYDLYLKKNFDFGGNLSFKFQNSILNTNSTRADINPSITPTFSLNFSQPLLRDGFNGMKYISIDKNNTISSKYQLKDKAIQLVARTQDAYWNLVLSKERLKVLENSIKLAQDLLEINKQKEKSGFLAKIDILSTEASIASRETSVLEAQKGVILNENNLKKLLNMSKDGLQDWEYDIEPIDKPAFKNIDINFKKSLDTAFSKRPDYQVTLLEQKNLDIQHDIATQNKLPSLNFNGSAGLEGLDSSYPSALGKVFGFQNYFWNFGLNFELPVVGNKQETLYKESEIKQEQEKAVLDNLKQEIYLDVKNSVTNVEINKKRIQANILAKKLADEQVKAETEKLNLGLSTNFQVLQFQRDYEQASLNEINATVDYIKSVNELAQLEGVLLENNNIVWDIDNENSHK